MQIDQNAGSRRAAAPPAAPTRLSVWAGSTRNATKRVVARHPSIYLPLARRRHPQATLGPETDLVIDGFTRTATTFALIAFQVAQNGHIRVAHHLHTPAHLEAAVRRRVPALVTIREPEGSVLSAMVREPTVSARQFLRSYVDFYQRLAALTDRLVVASFDEITADVGKVTRRVNARFGTSFAEFGHTDDEVATVFELIEERSSRPPWERLLGEFLAGRISLAEYHELTAEQRATMPVRRVPEASVQRPSAEREARKSALRAGYEAPSLARWRERAEAAYHDATTVTLP